MRLWAAAGESRKTDVRLLNDSGAKIRQVTGVQDYED